jgi:DNA-binding MarR family transcriptional regulator
MHTSGDRTLNLLGALAVGLGDRIAAATEETVGESATTVAALATVAQEPGCSIEELRHALGLSHSAAVRVVDRLAARGLVARRPGSRGPAVALTPTAAGARLAARVLDVRRRVVEEVAGEELPEDLESALEVLLGRLTIDPNTGHRICRLCDFTACPQDRCPVARRQRALS